MSGDLKIISTSSSELLLATELVTTLGAHLAVAKKTSPRSLYKLSSETPGQDGTLQHEPSTPSCQIVANKAFSSHHCLLSH
jgi:hypothetical protein